jgi:hypothetical protein
MDLRFALVEPVLETLVIDHPRQLSREGNRRSSQETEIQNECWPLWAAGAPDAPSEPWQRVPPPVPGGQAAQPQRLIAALLARARAGLRSMQSA